MVIRCYGNPRKMTQAKKFLNVSLLLWGPCGPGHQGRGDSHDRRDHGLLMMRSFPHRVPGVCLAPRCVGRQLQPFVETLEQNRILWQGHRQKEALQGTLSLFVLHIKASAQAAISNSTVFQNGTSSNKHNSLVLTLAASYGSDAFWLWEEQ